MSSPSAPFDGRAFRLGASLRDCSDSIWAESPDAIPNDAIPVYDESSNSFFYPKWKAVESLTNHFPYASVLFRNRAFVRFVHPFDEELHMLDGEGMEKPLAKRWYGHGHFNEGVCPMNASGDVFVLSNSWGYIDMEGDCVIKPRFSYAGPFVNGYAVVGLDGSYAPGDVAIPINQKFGVINRHGRFVIPPVFSEHIGYGWEGPILELTLVRSFCCSVTLRICIPTRVLDVLQVGGKP